MANASKTHAVVQVQAWRPPQLATRVHRPEFPPPVISVISKTPPDLRPYLDFAGHDSVSHRYTGLTNMSPQSTLQQGSLVTDSTPREMDSAHSESLLTSDGIT
jgi:hypothetical protein